MKKSKIAIKLTLNFTIALLIFSIIIAGIFLCLFKNYTSNMHKEQMEEYATALSDVLSGEESIGNGRGIGGYGAYIKFIDKVSKSSIWVVDTNGNLINKNMGHSSDNYNTSTLPSNAEAILDKVLNGENTSIEQCNDNHSQTNITVGVPIQKENEITGAVFISSNIDEIPRDVKQALTILVFSIIISLIIVIILSFILSRLFTKPLSKMKEVASNLSNHDYTARCNIKQNDEIGELGEILDILAKRLEEADKQSEKLDKMQKDFIANISHELRTPITVMRGSLEVLQENVITDKDKIQEYYKQMLLEAKFLERLVGDLLALARLQNTDFKIEISKLNLTDVINDVVRSAMQIANNKNITINKEIENNIYEINGDYERLRQMFLIILGNAIKFSKENSCIDVTFKNNQIIIRDYGEGIDEEHLPHIFDKFYKTYDKKNETGSGLGLAIANQIAKRHNIILEAKNADKGGAEFIFKL